MNSDISFIGVTNARQKFIPFGIKQADRLHHLYVIGKTGTGKTTLLRNLIEQDIRAGRGCALLDPHGDMVADVAASVPEVEQDRLIYFDVTDPKLQWGYNPLAFVSSERRPLLASGILEIFKKLWPKEWGVRMEHLFRNAILTLLEQPKATLSDVIRLFTDKSYLYQCLRNVQNESVQAFWRKEFAKYSYRLKAEATIPIANKLGGYLSNPTLSRILCNAPQTIRLRSVMDEQKILLVNLAKGQIGQDATNLLGSMLLTSIGLAAYSRSDIPEHNRTPFYTFVDEAHNFVTLSTANMMSELRKYGIGLTFANQYLHQMELDIREAITGNAGSVIAFRSGPQDAGYLEKEFGGMVTARDILQLPNWNMYLKLMIDGMPSKCFSGETALAI